MGDVSGVWGSGAEEMFLKESKLLSLLKMARHQLVSDLNNCSSLLVLSFEDEQALGFFPGLHLTSRYFL